MSTILPSTSRELLAVGATLGVKVLDVAISGSTPAIEQGTVTLLAGGDGELFEAAEPIFQAFAKQYFLMGPSGSGKSMNLVVNTLLGAPLAGLTPTTCGERLALVQLYQALGGGWQQQWHSRRWSCPGAKRLVNPYRSRYWI